MTPYYENKDAGITLYCGDCREILPMLEGVDAVVSDPPYGIDYVQGGGKGVAGKSRFCGSAVIGDQSPFDPKHMLLFPECLIWGANYYASRLPESGCYLVWDKRCGVTPERDQADCEIAWYSRGRACRVFRHVWDGMIRDSEMGEQRVHPTQKPVAVMEWCISRVTGKSICDPYMGSGTTGVACLRTGRKFIGIELSEAYCEIAVKRIKLELSQPRLFAPVAAVETQTELFQ